MKIITIAAANSSDADKAKADFVCDGKNDSDIINQALRELPTQGGKLVMSVGIYADSIELAT